MRKLEIFSDLLAMLIVLFVTVVPHHHHKAAICFAQEECLEDHCINDEHTMHSETADGDNDFLCIANERYYPEDELHLDWPGPVAIHLATNPCFDSNAFSASPLPRSSALPFLPASVLSWRINC